MVLTAFIGLTALVVGYTAGHKRASRIPEEWPIEEKDYYAVTGDAGSL